MKKIIILLAACALMTTALSAQHTIILKSGEKMSGEVKSLNDGVIKLVFLPS